jgi:pilus assembly protein Flp/PilA
MKKFTKSVKNFLVSEDGPTAVEYAVMLALIIVVCIVSIGLVGTSADATFSEVNDSLSGAGAGTP